MNTTVNINGIPVQVDSKIVANVIIEQEFCIDKDIHVLVYISQHNDRYEMSGWMNDGTEEIDTVDITDAYSESMDNTALITMMEQFIHEREDYIIDVARWDGN